MDINGDAFGLLAAHPLTPVVSIHHLDVIKPIFPNYTSGAALEHLGKAAKVESASVLQQSICYSKRQKWSFSISWGFVVQVYKGFETPRVLEMPIRTFQSSRRKTDKSEFLFNTRENPSDLCKQPSLYYMESTKGPSAATKGLLESVYLKEDNWKKRRYCEKLLEPVTSVKRIRVLKEPVKESWFQVSSLKMLATFIHLLAPSSVHPFYSSFSIPVLPLKSGGVIFDRKASGLSSIFLCAVRGKFLKYCAILVIFARLQASSRRLWSQLP